MSRCGLLVILCCIACVGCAADNHEPTFQTMKSVLGVLFKTMHFNQDEKLAEVSDADKICLSPEVMLNLLDYVSERARNDWDHETKARMLPIIHMLQLAKDAAHHKPPGDSEDTKHRPEDSLDGSSLPLSPHLPRYNN